MPGVLHALGRATGLDAGIPLGMAWESTADLTAILMLVWPT